MAPRQLKSKSSLQTSINMVLNRRRRKLMKQRAMSSVKPKKPLTGYNVFIQAYFFQNKDKIQNITPQALMAQGAKEWKTMSAERKAAFEEMYAVTRDKERYHNQMITFRERQQKLKRAPSSYALFVRDFWREKRENNDSQNMDFRKVAKEAREKWVSMGTGGRQVYASKHNEIKQSRGPSRLPEGYMAL